MGLATASGRPETFNWYAIYCRSQAERAVYDGLTQGGFETYFPSYFETRKWSDRQKTIERPLFPGYVFARFPIFPMSAESAVWQVRGVVAVLGTPADGPIAIPDRDIQAIRTLLSSGLRLHTEAPRFGVGELVTVRYGPLTGASGRILRRKGKLRLVITIQALGRATSVEVDREMLALPKAA